MKVYLLSCQQSEGRSWSRLCQIADLGLATCQTWSRLTKEESRRRSQKGRSSGARGAGTLSYMAPEHLDSIHTVSTEKSDVYSFAIVVWVILTEEEPYASKFEVKSCFCSCLPEPREYWALFLSDERPLVNQSAFCFSVQTRGAKIRSASVSEKGIDQLRPVFQRTRPQRWSSWWSGAGTRIHCSGQRLKVQYRNYLKSVFIPDSNLKLALIN